MAFHMYYISFSLYCSFRLLVFFACRKHIQGASQLVWLLVNSHAFHVPYFLTFGDCPHHILKKFLSVDGIVINMVVGGEVLTLKGLEESSGILIAEMPINVCLFLKRSCSSPWSSWFASSWLHLIKLPCEFPADIWDFVRELAFFCSDITGLICHVIYNPLWAWQ